jgi:hypothetical protein
LNTSTSGDDASESVPSATGIPEANSLGIEALPTPRRWLLRGQVTTVTPRA